LCRHSNLVNQSALVEIVNNDKHATVRSKAAERLKDKTVIAELTKNDNIALSNELLDKISDQSLLIGIAINQKRSTAERIYAFKKLATNNRERVKQEHCNRGAHCWETIGSKENIYGQTESYYLKCSFCGTEIVQNA
jgi:hypothetical protein